MMAKRKTWSGPGFVASPGWPARCSGRVAGLGTGCTHAKWSAE